MRRHKYFHFTVRAGKHWETVMRTRHHFYAKRRHHHKFHRISSRRYHRYFHNAYMQERRSRANKFWFAPAAKKVLGSNKSALPKADLSSIKHLQAQDEWQLQ